MKKDLIWRLNRASDSDLTYVCHSHPFTSLPYLKSHLRPQFAIFNAGLKLMKAVDQKRVQKEEEALEQQQLENLVNDSPDLTLVMDLYKAWDWKPPEGHEEEQSYFPPDPSDDDVDVVVVDDDKDSDYDDSIVSRSKKRKRKAPKQKESAQKPPPKGHKRKQLSVPFRHQSLSEMTLSRLEQLGRAGWTRKNIHKWSIGSPNYSYASSIVT
jgi:hypothetical protein